MSKKINKNTILEGQIFLWDIIAEREIQKQESVVLETINYKKYSQLTEEQQKIVTAFVESPKLNRIVHACGGGLVIELKEGDEYSTKYFNKLGIEEFKFNKKISVLPMDKIIENRVEFITNARQEEALYRIKEKLSEFKAIKRIGDENILVETSNKVISITAEGRIIEFNDVQAIYTEDEVLRELVIDLKEIQKSVKVGDLVEASFRSGIITGEITREYGSYNDTLNISFDNRTKSTAIARVMVRKIIKSA